MIYLGTGTMSQGMSFSSQLNVLCCAHCPADRIGGNPNDCTAPDCAASRSTPPAENSNPPGASGGADGQGACTPKRSNLDNTRRRAVVKGCKVRFPGGAIATVARVRLGEFWTTTGTVKPWPTEFVWVVA